MTPPPPPPPRPPSAPPILRVDSPALKPEDAGDRIGRYKLLQQIGEGGFGVVWMAEQEVPVRRRVALKIIKLGMDTKQVIARFEAERQALAMMDHPNIAKVLDAGATATGRPFFVMELVRGIRITEFCDQSKLAAADRLGLFVQVCHAVQHAHQKGIIHRDLKPSNIMVTLHDGVPVPKVIDFGVAKATQARLTDLTLFTQFDQMIGTPLYMSPEQAEMSGLDVDTRTDIYSLGVLLYELLAGRTPFDGAELTRRGLDEMRRAIRETDPPRPSTRFSTLAAEARSTVADQRQAEPAKLMGLLRGDLDWVVMKALEKDRTRRYETANDFAMDVKRFLDGEPVVARPPSGAYRLQKLVRRNKLAFAAGAAVALALIAAITAGTWQAMRAGREKKRAANAVAQLAETAPAFADEARALAARGQFDEALDKLAFAARLRPDVADYAARQGDIRESQLRIADALEAYRTALKISPGHARAKANAVLCARIVALNPDRAKPSLEVLAPLHGIMQREQRSAGEQAPVAKLFSAERKRVVDEWLPKVQALGAATPNALDIAEDGQLSVNLSGSRIADLTPLAAFPLSSLNLSGCAGVADLQPLAGLKLTALMLDKTGVTNLSPLAKMSTLTRLNIAGTKVADYEPLAALPLETLLCSAPVRDLAFLRRMPLRWLRIADAAAVRNLAVLSEITTIETLELPPESWAMPEAEVVAIEKLRTHPALRFVSMADGKGEPAAPQQPKEQFWREWDRANALPRALRAAGIRGKLTWLPGSAWSLDLSGQKLTDLSVLKGQLIGTLALDGTRVSDLSPLRGMPLETLRLVGCPVADLAPLANAPLKNLWMDDTVTATDFSPLATLAALETVLLPPQATDIASLRALPGLRRISYTEENNEPACSAEIFWKAWDGLAWLRALREAKVAHTATQRADGGWDVAVTDAAFADASIFKGATGIRKLKLAGTKVADIAALRGIPLISLDVGGTNVADLSPLAEAPLEALMAYDTPITNLAVLRSPPVRAALNNLGIWGTKITDFSPIAECRNLEQLVLTGMGLTSLDAFKGMKLRMLHITRTAVSDLSAITTMPFLGQLAFCETAVSDIRPLLACPTLRRVGLSALARDIEPLRAHPGIKTLDYTDNFDSKARSVEQFWVEWDETRGLTPVEQFGKLADVAECAAAAEYYQDALNRSRAQNPPRDSAIHAATASLSVVAFRWAEVESSAKRQTEAEEKANWARQLMGTLPDSIGETKNASILRNIVSLRSRVGDWPRTLEALARLEELAPGTPWDRERLLPLYVDAGDNDRAAAFGEDMLTRREKNKHAPSIIHSIPLLSVLPSLGANPRVAKLLEFAAADPVVQEKHKDVLQLAQGLVAFRAGRFAESIEPLAEVASNYDFWLRAYALPALAMAQHQLGHTEEVHAALTASAKARKDLLALGAPLGFGPRCEWQNVLAADLLRREAGALIGQPTKPAAAAPMDAKSAESLARAGNFADAARVTRERFARVGKEPEVSSNYSAEHLIFAAALLAAGDREGYRAACAEAVHSFGDSTSVDHAERIGKACLLAPDSGIEPATLAAIVATAQPALENRSHAMWVQLLNALAEYRAGHFDTAAGWVEKLRANPDSPARGLAAADAILAMAEHHRQRSAEARAALEAAQKSVAANWPAGGEGAWHAWLIADLLTKEAATLLR